MNPEKYLAKISSKKEQKKFLKDLLNNIQKGIWTDQLDQVINEERINEVKEERAKVEEALKIEMDNLNEIKPETEEYKEQMDKIEEMEMEDVKDYRTGQIFKKKKVDILNENIQSAEMNIQGNIKGLTGKFKIQGALLGKLKEL